MSRKSDIELAFIIMERHGDVEGLEAAYNLGRAAQAEQDARATRGYVCTLGLQVLAKRLRAKVRRAGGK